MIEQSNKHLRNRNALSKFMAPIANRSLRNMITPGMKKKFREDKNKSPKGEKKLRENSKDDSNASLNSKSSIGN